MFLRLSQGKENEKIRHRRVQQEKGVLLKQIDKMKKVYEDDEVIYAELKKKYWDLMKETMMLEQNLKTAKEKVANMRDTEEKLQKNVNDLNLAVNHHRHYQHQ